MCSKRVFNVKDKVFATTPGYPPWPAIITDIVINSSFKLRYNVYFYGTGGYSLCKSKQLVPYQNNKLKFSNPEGKLNVLQHFAKALLQIESDTDSLGHTTDDESTCNINNIQTQESSSDELEKISDIFREIITKSEEKKRIKGQPNLRKKKNKVKPSNPKMYKTIFSDQSDEDVFTTSNNINSSNQKSSSDKLENINQVEEINPSNLEGKRKIEVKEDSSMSKKQKHESKKNECVISNQIISDLSDEDIQEFTTSSHINNTNQQSSIAEVDVLKTKIKSFLEKKKNKDESNLLKINKEPIKIRSSNIFKSEKDAQLLKISGNINYLNQKSSRDKLVTINETLEINQLNLEGDKNIKFKEESSLSKKHYFSSKKNKTGCFIIEEISSDQSDEDKQELTTYINDNNENQQSFSDELKNNNQVKVFNQSNLEDQEKITYIDESNLLKNTKSPNILNVESVKGAQVFKTLSNLNYSKQSPFQDKLEIFNNIAEITQFTLECEKEVKQQSSLSIKQNIASKPNKQHVISKNIFRDQFVDMHEFITLSNINYKNPQTFSDELKNGNKVDIINQSNLEIEEKIINKDTSNLLTMTNKVPLKRKSQNISEVIPNIKFDKDVEVCTISCCTNYSKSIPSKDKLESINEISKINLSNFEYIEKIKGKEETSSVEKQNISSTKSILDVISKEICSDKTDENMLEFVPLSNTNHQLNSDNLKNINQVEEINKSYLKGKEKIINKDESNLINTKKNVPLKKRTHNTSEIFNIKSDKDAQVFTPSSNINYSKEIEYQDKLAPINEVLNINQSSLEYIDKIKGKEETSSVKKQNLTSTKNILEVISKEICSDKTDENMLEFVPLSKINNKNHQLFLDKLKNSNQFEGININQSNLEGKEKLTNKDESNLINIKKNIPLKKRSHNTSEIIPNTKSDKDAQIFTLPCNTNYSKLIPSQDKLESINEITEINQSNLEYIEVEVNEKINSVEKQNLTLSKNVHEFISLSNINNTSNQLYSVNLKNINQDEKIISNDELNLLQNNFTVLRKRTGPNGLYTSTVISDVKSDKDAQLLTTSSYINYSREIESQDKLASINEVLDTNQFKLKCLENIKVEEQSNLLEKQHQTSTSNQLNIISKETSSDQSNMDNMQAFNLGSINNTNHQSFSDTYRYIVQFESINQYNSEGKVKIINKDEPTLINKNKNIPLKKRSHDTCKVISNTKSDKDAQVFTIPCHINYTKSIPSQNKLEPINEITEINQSNLESIVNIKFKEVTSSIEKQNLTLSKNAHDVISKEMFNDKTNEYMLKFEPIGYINNTNHQSFLDKFKNTNKVEGINRSYLEFDEIIKNNDEFNLLTNNNRVLRKSTGLNGLYASKVVSNVKSDNGAKVVTSSSNSNSTKKKESQNKLASTNEVLDINQFKIENIKVKEKSNLLKKQNRKSSRNMTNVISKEMYSDQSNMNALSSVNNTNHKLNSDTLENINMVEGINQSNLDVDKKKKTNDELNSLKKNNRVLRKRTVPYGLNASKAISKIKHDKGAKVVTSSSNISYCKEIESQDKLESINEVLDINQFKLKCLENIKVKEKSNLLEKQNRASNKNMTNVISKETCSDRSNEIIEEVTLSSVNNTNHQLHSDKLKNINIVEGRNQSNLEVDEKIKNNIVLRKRKIPHGLNASKVLSNVKSDKVAQIFTTSSSLNHSEQRSSPVQSDKIQQKSKCSLVSQNIKRNFFRHVPSGKLCHPKYLDEKLNHSVSVHLDKLSDYFISKALGKQPKYAAYYIVNAEGQLIKTNGPSVESSDMIVNSCNDSKPMTAVKYIYQMNSNNNDNANYVTSSDHKKKLNTCASKKQIVDNDKIDHSQEHSSKTEDIIDLNTKGMIYEKELETNADYRKLLKAQVELEINIMNCLKMLVTNLQIRNFNYGAAIAALDRLHEFKFTTLTLLKYKIILDTISKVSQYCISNVNELISSQQERIIRYKAQTLFNVLMSLFTVSPGETFEKVYNKEFKDFSKKIKYMNSRQIIEYTQYSDLL